MPMGQPRSANSSAAASKWPLPVPWSLKRGLPLTNSWNTSDRTAIRRIQDIFRPYYAAHCAIQTGEYTGISQLLRQLRANGIQTTVVSNKPDPAVQKLTADYFQDLFDFSLGEQPQIRRKPAPDMVLKALKDLGLTPEQAVYIGDSEIDIQTAKNAGLDCISVTWGFRSKTFLEKHGARFLIDTPEEIARFF